MGERGRAFAVLAFAATALLSPAAAAQSVPNNHYAIDVYQGPILAPSDVMGIAGAYAGIAEGIAGMVANAAAPALREPLSVTHMDWDLSGSFSIPIKIFGNDDFDNSGSQNRDFSNFLYGTAGGLLQYGLWGVGFNAELQRYSLTQANGYKGTSSDVTLGKYHALGGLRMLGNQLIVGGGARLCTLGLTPRDNEASLTMVGAAPEFGIIVRPDWEPYRIGATVRFPVHGGPFFGGPVVTHADGTKTVAGLVLPEDVVLPWEIEVGAAYQIGPRPLNPNWIEPTLQDAPMRAWFSSRREARRRAREVELATLADPSAREARARELEKEDEAIEAKDRAEEKRLYKRLQASRRDRYWSLPREHLLITAEVLLTGPVNSGVSIQRFLGQNQGTDASVIGTSGANVSASARFGLETEPIPGLMHTRMGTYFEPGRLDGRVYRQHFTFGADLRLFSTTWFGLVPLMRYKAQAYADFSPRYQSISVSLGVWH